MGQSFIMTLYKQLNVKRLQFPLESKQIFKIFYICLFAILTLFTFHFYLLTIFITFINRKYNSQQTKLFGLFSNIKTFQQKQKKKVVTFIRYNRLSRFLLLSFFKRNKEILDIKYLQEKKCFQVFRIISNFRTLNMRSPQISTISFSKLLNYYLLLKNVIVK
jgi:hypothetical protein